MQARFLLGPAGSGKTYRCLEEIAGILRVAPAGPPLILLAPKQATFQLERQLLSDYSVSGYTRLFIFSFERLAYFLIESLERSALRLLSSDGRIMVLRNLLGRRQDELKLFRSTATLQGFAGQLSALFEELQREDIGEAGLIELAARIDSSDHLAYKLHDIGLMLGAYGRWLAEHQVHDGEQLLPLAIAAVKKAEKSCGNESKPLFRFGGFWVDGFSELTEQELRLLWLLLPHADRATFALNLGPASDDSMASPWSLVSKTYQRLRSKLSGLAECEVCWLDRDPVRSRFSRSPVLDHLERHWGGVGKSRGDGVSEDRRTAECGEDLELYCCATPEEEAILAARSILRFVREGGRYRDMAIIVRDLDAYYAPLRHIFSQYEIPFFLDRRESVAVHPLIELILSAWRITVFHWQNEDWFGALKTGLMPVSDEALDGLENEAIERGWNGESWVGPLTGGPFAAECEKLRQELTRPLLRLQDALGQNPDGFAVTAALRQFYADLGIQEQLETWSEKGKEPIHLAVWEQNRDWLANIELAFAREKMPLREWLAILETGLTSQTVGLIPPALDQVLIGAIDRSRNPDLRFVLLLGLNESVFPARQPRAPLLTNREREQMAEFEVRLGRTARDHLAQEQYFGYIAFTRARERVLASYALRAADGALLNPSPFLTHLRKLFPALREQRFTREGSAAEWLHPGELSARIVSDAIRTGNFGGAVLSLQEDECFKPLREALPRFEAVAAPIQLDSKLAEQLYGQSLKTSVSGLEDFAGCQFRFFVKSGLEARERIHFELDAREQGTFQHEVLAEFHNRLAQEKKRWRDLAPSEAVTLVREISNNLQARFKDGLAQATARTRFLTAQMTSSLEDFIHAIITWNRDQYLFDPHSVELPFGREGDLLPAWDIPLEGGHTLSLRGKIDRVDIRQDSGNVLCVVIDYKSSGKELDPLLVQNGIQLQLLAYLNVVQIAGALSGLFPKGNLIPAGVFYLNLRGRQTSITSRAHLKTGKGLAYQHLGRFNVQFLPLLDSKSVEPPHNGDQFKYRLAKGGASYKNDTDPMAGSEFHALLRNTEEQLRRMGLAIFAGAIEPNPYRKSTQKACDYCEYQGICRIDPAEFPFRRLGRPGAAPQE